MSSEPRTCGDCKFYHEWTRSSGRAGDCAYLASILLPRSVCWEDIDSSMCACDNASMCLCFAPKAAEAGEAPNA